MRDLGPRIRTLRKQRGLTQAQLAADICTKSFVSQVEKGQANPSIDTLHAFAERLGVTLADLVGSGEPRLPPAWMVEELEHITSLLETEEYNRARSRVLLALGRTYELAGNRERALEVYRRAAEIAARPERTIARTAN